MGKKDNNYSGEERWKLTPKGCAVAAMYDVGIITDADDKKIDEFWNKYVEIMDKLGYLGD